MSLTIMAVDDQPEILVSIRAMLEPMGSYVLTFKDSREAAERVNVQQFDAVFVDVQMPYLDGFELTKLIRSSKRNAKVPVIMLTDLDDIQTMRSAFKAGATYFLGKPIAAERVRSLFNAVLGPVLMQRRKQARLPFQTSVKYSFDQNGNEQFVARSLNISVSGMALQYSTGLEVGQTLKLEFSLPSVDQPLRLPARVQRLIPPNQCGVNFIEPSLKDREAIQAFLFPVAATGLVKTAADEASNRGDKTKSLFKPVAYATCALVVFYLSYQAVRGLRTPTSDTSLDSLPVLKLACEVQTAPPSQPIQHAAVDSPFLLLYPAAIQAQYIPGQSVSYTLNLNNQSGQDLTFKMTAEDMLEMQGRLLHVAAGELANGIAASVSFSSSTVSVKSGKAVSVKVTVPMPLASPVHSVQISMNGADKIRSWRGVFLQASPGTVINFGGPAGSEQKGTTSDELPQSSMMNYTVCQWRAP